FLDALCGLVVGAPIARRDRVARTDRRRVETTIGLGAVALVLFGGFGWFLLARTSFIGHAHDVAAISLFASIVAVALVNARGYGRRTTGSDRVALVYRNRYTLIATLMVLTPIALWLVSQLVAWEHRLLWIEASMLGLFAAFWALQTQELWNEGIRQDDLSTPAGSHSSTAAQRPGRISA